MMKMRVILFLSILVFISFKESQSSILIYWINKRMATTTTTTTKHVNGNINETFEKSIKSRAVK